MPTPSRWHPLPTTAVAYADSGGEEWEVVMEVMKVMKVMEVIKVRKAVVWKEHAMVGWMCASPSASHAEIMWPGEVMDGAKVSHAAEAVHTARTVHAAHHRVGRHHRRNKHRYYDDASSRYFSEHDNPPRLSQISPRAIVRTKFATIQMTNDLISDRCVSQKDFC
jgi:hypothetical protein